MAFVHFVACYNARAVIALPQNRSKWAESNVYLVCALVGMDIAVGKPKPLAFFERLFKVQFYDAVQTPHLPDFFEY